MKAGANVNTYSDDGTTPLFVAAYNGHPDIATRLVDAGADVNSKSDYGTTPLIVATENGHTEII